MKEHKNPQDIEEKLISSLRNKGYKLTPQRREIIRLLARDRSHPGAMDIFGKVRKTAPRISVSTVYYTIDIMKREGLLGELEFYDKDNRYDVNISDHINLVCSVCGKITDFTGDVPAFSKAVVRETGFRPTRMRFEYYGVCEDCAGARGR